MYRIYATLIIAHRKDFVDVKPEELKPAVEAELKRRGFDTNGEKIEGL